MQENALYRTPSPWLSLLPIAVLVALLALTIYIFGSDALGGGSQVALLIATAVCVAIGMGVLRRPWAIFEETMVRNISGVGTATILSVSTLTYLPYCFFNLISPLMSILVAWTGYKIRRHDDSKEK